MLVNTPRLDIPSCDKYDICYKFALRSGPGFHAEWLRDEPCDATATGSGASPSTGANSLPETGNMRFGVQRIRIPQPLFL